MKILINHGVDFSEAKISLFNSLEMINANPDKPWDWSGISCNKFKKHEVLVKRKFERLKEKNYSMNFIQELVHDWTWVVQTKK